MVIFMETTETLRKKIQFLYEKNVPLHMDVSMTHPKIQIENAEVVIKDVYPYIFRVETTDTASPQCYTLQYADVMTGHIRITELELLKKALAKRKASKKSQTT